MNVETAVRVRLRWLVVLAITAGCGPTQSAHPDSVPFTGEVKPVLYVSDVELAAPYYRDLLGFEFLGFTDRDGAPYYAEMAAASLKFGLHEAMSTDQESRVGQQRLYFRVKNVTEHHSQLVAAGAAPSDIIETDWMDMFIVNDPDGHEIVFAFTDPAEHAVDPW